MRRAAVPLSLALVSALALALPGIAFAQAPAGGVDWGTPASPGQAWPGTIALTVDATDTARRVFHVRQSIPVSPGPLTLLFPKWIPGKHRADGPIHKLAGLRIRGNGRPLHWTRDPGEVFAFMLEVPEGVASLDVEFDMLTPTSEAQGRVVMTSDMLNLQWNTVALYPANHAADRIRFAPTLVLPPGWQAGTALDLQARSGDTLRYGEVDFETLQDSPVYAGRHFRRVDLDPGAARPVHLDIVADAPRYLDASDAQLKAHRALVQQAYRLFGSRHFDHYDFLFSLSDRMGGNGLEHHRSSENGVAPGYFTDWDAQVASRDLLPHEFVHSWNGKFRRPEGLATPNFQVPMRDELLWVYEGQTQYWGMVLAARSGLWSRDDAMAQLALVAATYAVDRPGLDWRSVLDTTHDPIIAMRRPQPWRSYQLSEDYYNAGALVWLSVDAKLRELSKGRRSLDDFAAAFFGVDDGRWEVKPYDFDDVVATLQGVAGFDWATFLRSRIEAHRPPLDGLEAAGWRLAYRDTPSAFHKALLAQRKQADYTASIGLAVRLEDAVVSGVRWDGPAFDAGITEGATLLAVNGYAFEPALLDDAIKAAQAGGPRVELVVKHGEVVKTVSIDYRDGLKYPYLERIAGRPDRLAEILKPL
ncbi:M61 family metallopeptidase [Marilutibacter spongiae]|uniref:M61 family metallopeptidase n=1 Tax=Marilutibacter spongiae TaxID=2025720 RepID=A0A7W3Y6Z9_9GAMM|nr:M61 family metallopeptidase [Lysobacter spongiae]MBB1061560.1 M61 family metallopeptidase [Lysobacter spongiae]